MANLFNYPQVIMSLYDVPMESSGALSLGTTAGVGSSFSTTHSFTQSCSGGTTSSTWYRGSYADGNFIYWASCFNGLNSFPISGGTYCDIICPVDGSFPYDKLTDITKSGNYFFVANEVAGGGYGLLSFTADSNADMTIVDEYRIGFNYPIDQHLYPDTTLPLIYEASNCGITVYCYNTSTGAIGHTDYDYSDVRWACSVYSYIRSVCKIVVLSRRFDGLAVWCMNTSTCMLGNYMCNSFTGDWLLDGNSCVGSVWGGCSTGCQLSDGGYFLVANRECGIGVVCTYDDSGTTKLCLKTCATVATYFCSGDYLENICGDNTYIYATGRCSIIYRLTLNCSTGVLTCVDSYEYCNTTCPAFYPKLHTREGYCLFVSSGPNGTGGHVIGKPAPHYSISGLYGGADNTDVALSHYYKGGSYVNNTSGNANVPTSGAIDFSDFYGQGN